MVICPHCNAATRVGHQVLGDGMRTRACKKCGATIEKQ
jgi:large subunit ribosomal protein L24